MFMYHSKRISVLLVTLAHAMLFTQADSNFLGFITETYKDLCPYSRTCTRPAKNIFPSKGTEETTPCCRQCSCEKDCWTRRDCCPDVEDVTGMAQSDADHHDTECLTTAFPIVEHEHSGMNSLLKRYVTVNDCPKSYTNQTVLRLCETSDPKTLLEVSTVSDAAGNIYKNDNCAICNGANVFKRWNMYVTCGNIGKLETKLTVDTLKQSDCEVWSVDQQMEPHTERMCYVATHDKCNMTGRWKTYDRRIEHACETGQYGVYHIGFKQLYANVFCFICNENFDTMKDTCPLEIIGTRMFLRPFSAILDMSTIDDNNDHHQPNLCERNEIYDRYAVSK